jgi:hypothetical protein
MTEHVELASGTLHYECAGDGPVVVLAHALAPRAWGWPLERLARDCTVIAIGRFEPRAPTHVAVLGGPLVKRRPAELPQSSAAESAKRRAASWVHEPGPVRGLVETLDLQELTRTPQAFQRIMEDNRHVRQVPPPMELEKITVPTLILAGRHSLVMGPTQHRPLHSDFNARQSSSLSRAHTLSHSRKPKNFRM